MNLSKLVFAVGIVFITGLVNVPAFASANSSLPIIFPSPAYCTDIGPYNTIAVPLLNTLTDPITAVIIGVLHNSIGQPLQVTDGSITLMGGGNVTVHVPVYLPYANYSVNVFVWSVNGSSISSEQSNLLLTC
ncbi:MAG: hypothetical protein ACHQ1H_05155 [Nitrososphaerales archaeon]